MHGRWLQAGSADVWEYYPIMTGVGAGPVYDWQRKVLLVPAGALQPPLLPPSASDLVAMGGLGSLMGDQLTHLIDTFGKSCYYSTADRKYSVAASW